MDDQIESLRQEVQHLIAMNTASYVAITSLVATHPNPQQLQLHLVSALEPAAVVALAAAAPRRSTRSRCRAR
jgi:hypothetical protein